MWESKLQNRMTIQLLATKVHTNSVDHWPRRQPHTPGFSISAVTAQDSERQILAFWLQQKLLRIYCQGCGYSAAAGRHRLPILHHDLWHTGHYCNQQRPKHPHSACYCFPLRNKETARPKAVTHRPKHSLSRCHPYMCFRQHTSHRSLWTAVTGDRTNAVFSQITEAVTPRVH